MALSDVEVQRINLYNSGSMRAFVDVVVRGVLIKGAKIMDGSKGLWVAMPSKQQKNDPTKWEDIVAIKDKALQEDVQEIVLAAYNAKASE